MWSILWDLGDLVNNNKAVDGEEAGGDQDGIIGIMIGTSDNTYLMMSISNPDDDRTVHNWYKTHGADSFWFKGNLNNNYDYYDIVVDYENLNGFWVTRCNIMGLDNNEMCTYNIRLIYDDGGRHNMLSI